MCEEFDAGGPRLFGARFNTLNMSERNLVDPVASSHMLKIKRGKNTSPTLNIKFHQIVK